MITSYEKKKDDNVCEKDNINNYFIIHDTDGDNSIYWLSSQQWNYFYNTQSGFYKIFLVLRKPFESYRTKYQL
jgi:hypothetical protein